MFRTIALFIVASIFEVGGCYFIWQSIKADKGILYGSLGSVFLIVYGLLATLHTTSFTKVFVVYGVVFISTSILWAMIFENYKMGGVEILGILMVFIGATVFYLAP